MKKLLLLVLTTLLIPTYVAAQWAGMPAPGGSEIKTDAATLGVTGDFRGCAFDATSGNLAVPVEDDDTVIILDNTLTKLATITGADVGDGTVDPYKIAVSDDGQIFTNGFAGTVERVGPMTAVDAVSADVVVVDSTLTGGIGSSRAMTVRGDWSAGSLVVAVGHGTSNVFVCTQADNDPSTDTFVVADTIAAGFTSEVEDIYISEDKSTIYILNNGGALKKLDGAVGSGWTEDASFTTGGLWRTGLGINEADGMILATIDSGSLDGIVVSHMTLGNAGAASYKVYGPTVLNNGSGGPAIDAANDVVYLAGGGQVVKVSADLAVTAPGDVVINELSTVNDGTDASEYVEIYGPADTVLSDLNLLGGNGSPTTGGSAFITIDLTGYAIPSDGYFVVSANAATVPNTDLDVSPDTNLFQNGDPDAVWIERKSDSATIDGLGYFATYNAAPPAPGVGLMVATWYEGDPCGLGGDDEWGTQIGTTAMTTEPTPPYINASIGRLPDGADTDDNWTDFHTLFVASPGASNAATQTTTIPVAEDFSQASGLLERWIPAFVAIALETAATATPAGIPDSPDATTPTEWASIKDESGGGDAAHIMGLLAQDYFVEAYVFNATTAEQEDCGLMARVTNVENNTTASYDITQPISTYGDSYYGITVDLLANTAQAVKVYKSTRTLLGSAVAIPADAWAKLSINCQGGTITFKVNDSQIEELTGEPVWMGFVGVGYRESAATTGSVRMNFDGLQILADDPGTAVDEWMMLDD